MSVISLVSNPFNGGFGYAMGDTGTVTQAGAAGGIYTVLIVDATGRVLSVSVTGGTGYTTAGILPTSVSTGAGDGRLFVHIIAAGGALVMAAVENVYAGYGFAVGDAGTIQQIGVGPAATYLISAVDAFSQVEALTISNGGLGYGPNWDTTTSISPAYFGDLGTTATSGSGNQLFVQVMATGTLAGGSDFVAQTAQIQPLYGGARYPAGAGGSSNSIVQQNFEEVGYYTVLSSDLYGCAITVSVGQPAPSGPPVAWVSLNLCTTLKGGGGQPGDGELELDIIVTPSAVQGNVAY